MGTLVTDAASRSTFLQLSEEDFYGGQITSVTAKEKLTVVVERRI